ncbi:class I SAM-dependent methyltransferase [Parafrankia sp. FMc2]|uniref:class I SAM-dependent methyltransferase n=1 Tax=Parafrankia sp. FMc2 TaxID=3233196 RepID=UPI0034D7702A
MHFDATGKVSLDHIYDQPDPRAYFTTLRTLDYRIPELARPYFVEAMADYRAARRPRPEDPHGRHPSPLKVLDIGSSYGINPALLRCGVTLERLYERYGEAAAQGCSREELLARDRELVRSTSVVPLPTSGHRNADGSSAGSRSPEAVFVGLDVSDEALSYALAAGFLDDAVQADLETGELTERQRQQLAGTDLVISTGCLGYVGERTISRVLDAVAAADGKLPWMAHFVLRMFPFDAIGASLRERGYETVTLDRKFRQRRFASAQEQQLVLDSLTTGGIDPHGLESDGWMYAQLYVSRPRSTSAARTAPTPALRDRHPWRQLSHQQ